jgi:hypothetical protein
MPHRRRLYRSERLATRRNRALPFPFVGLDGERLLTSVARKGGKTYLSLSQPFDGTVVEATPSIPSRLVELGQRLDDELEARLANGTLTKLQVQRILALLRDAGKGVRELAEEEGVSAAAISCCIKTVIEHWPAFERAWTAKKPLIRRRKPRCSTDFSSES